jgi:hypothetical protein
MVVLAAIALKASRHSTIGPFRDCFYVLTILKSETHEIVCVKFELNSTVFCPFYFRFFW